MAEVGGEFMRDFVLIFILNNLFKHNNFKWPKSQITTTNSLAADSDSLPSNKTYSKLKEEIYF